MKISFHAVKGKDSLTMRVDGGLKIFKKQTNQNIPY